MKSLFAGTRAHALLVLALVAVGTACGRGAADRPAEQAAVGVVDSVPEVPARVAPVFRLAREQGGVRVALDSLQALMERDKKLVRGHELAHALGRFAMAERRELSVLWECTPIFQSGCVHGALEGYFQQGRQVDSASVAAVCPARPAPDQPGYELLECWHGLGHGLMVHFGGDFRQALPLCDALPTSLGRRECQDGVFMERAVRAVGGGSAPDAVGGHGGHGAHGGAQPRLASTAELLQLCTGVDARYQPSCWAYQPVAFIAVHEGEPRPVLRACDAAPADAVRDCYRGFGKQYLGLRAGNTRAMIRACRQGSEALVPDCILGGVEYFTDLEWTIEPGVEFCRRVPGDAKPACYDLIGKRLALVHPRPAQARAACRAVEADFVQTCLAGAASRAE